MNYILFNIKLGFYESQIVKYNYQYSMDSVKELLEDNPSIFIENGGHWIFVKSNKRG